MRSLAFALALTAISIAISYANDPLLEAINITKETNPNLADELKNLVARSEAAKKFLSTREGRPADPTEKYFPRQFLAYCALESTNWNFHRFECDYPELCKGAEVHGTARDETGCHWVVYRFNGDLALGRLSAVTGEFGSDQDPFELPFESSWCTYDTIPDPRGDILTIRFRPRGSADDKVSRVVTEHLIIKGGKLTRLKRVIEEYPIDRR